MPPPAQDQLYDDESDAMEDVEIIHADFKEKGNNCYKTKG